MRTTFSKSNMPEYMIALSTCSPIDAERIARELVEKRACACVNIVPHITSIYRWKGTIEMETESILIMKSVSSQVKLLRKLLKEMHPYEVPELLILDVADGLEEYLSWLRMSVTDTRERTDV